MGFIILCIAYLLFDLKWLIFSTILKAGPSNTGRNTIKIQHGN